MKNTLFIYLFFFSFGLFSQGVIINEFSNGPSDSQEWIELLVVGDSNNPTANVDLTNWIVDDNGGNFSSSVSGVGIAYGHLKFTNHFNSVPPGSIILLYNGRSKAPNIPADDPSDSNHDNIYILPGSHSFMKSNMQYPNIGNTSYAIGTLSPTAYWFFIGFRNQGDAVQTRKPNGDFYHGFSYGDLTSVFPQFPSKKASFNIGSGQTGLAYELSCGDWEEKASYGEINQTVSSPGNVNNLKNQEFISKIKSGTIDYSNLSNTCKTTIPSPPSPSPPVEVNLEITVPNVFSPNQDGINDYFKIKNLENYPNNSLSVINRWGNVVFTQKNYNNGWNGEDQLNGNKLTPGTYYFILKLTDKDIRKGSLSLFR